MFKQYSYKQKFVVLLLVFVMLSITAYKRSFSTLFQVIQENNKLSNQINQLKGKAKNTDKLMYEVATLDRIIGKEGLEPQEVQQKIVNFVTSNGNVSIYDLQPIHYATDGNYEINTNQIDVTGNVNQLLQVCYNFENEFDYSRLSSINLSKNKKNSKIEKLHMTMIFQNYKAK